MTNFDDIKLQVGARLQITLQRGALPAIYFTPLIGYVSGEYLLMRIPLAQGKTVPIQVGERVTLRAFSGMNVMTFESEVLSVLQSPFFLVQLAYPTKIQSTPLRKAIRVKVKLPAHVNGMPEYATITDISLDGAQITAAGVLGEAGATIPLSFTFQIKPTNQEVQIETSATIRTVRELPAAKGGASEAFTYGVSFDHIDPSNQVMLQNLVYESLLGQQTPSEK